MVKYKKEDIDDDDSLFYRVHISSVRNGKIIPGAFRDRVDGMSCDWSKYSDANISLSRSSSPDKNSIVEIYVEQARQLKDIEVEHDPLPKPGFDEDNRSHSLLVGIPKSDPDKTKRRVELRDMSILIIKALTKPADSIDIAHELNEKLGNIFESN